MYREGRTPKNVEQIYGLWWEEEPPWVFYKENKEIQALHRQKCIHMSVTEKNISNFYRHELLKSFLRQDIFRRSSLLQSFPKCSIWKPYSNIFRVFHRKLTIYIFVTDSGIPRIEGLSQTFYEQVTFDGKTKYLLMIFSKENIVLISRKELKRPELISSVEK